MWIKEAERIKNRLRAAKSRKEIEEIANEERATVMRMYESKDGRPLAIHISKLKSYQIGQIGAQHGTRLHKRG